MRIILAMNLPYEPALGGANKANRIIAEMLVARGHPVRAVVPMPSKSSQTACFRHLREQGEDVVELKCGYSFRLAGVDVHVVDGPLRALQLHLTDQLREFDPDCVLISSEDPMQLLLGSAIRHRSASIVYIAHTPSCLPFGPASFDPGPHRAQLLSHT